MEEGVLKDYSHASEFSMLNLSSKVNSCWERTVKRKFDSTSNVISGGSALEWRDNIEQLKARDTGAGHCQEPYDSLIPNNKADSANAFRKDWHFRSSILQDQFSKPEDESRLHGRMINDRNPNFAQTCTTEDVGRNEVSNKRIYRANVKRKYQMPSEAHPSLAASTQIETSFQNSRAEIDTLALREALISERKALKRLYEELEQERCASATAANEAMAMIARLQEEKAGLLMEAKHYKRVAEERDAYSQEAIALLREALLEKEDDLLTLQAEIDAYRKVFARIEAGELVPDIIRGNYLEDCKDRELLLLEGQDTAFLPVVESTSEKCHRQTDINCTLINGDREFQYQNKRLGMQYGNHSTYSVSDDVRMERLDYSVAVDHEYDEEQVGAELWTAADRINGSHGKHNSSSQTRLAWEKHRGQEDEVQCSGSFEHETATEIHPQEQSLEAVSMSILARVKRLEERFEHLGTKQEDFETSPSPRWESSGDVLSERRLDFSVEKFEDYKCASSRMSSVKDFENGTGKGSSSLLNNGNVPETEACRISELNIDGGRASIRQENFYGESSLDSGEGIHDVYEVQLESRDALVKSESVSLVEYGDIRDQAIESRVTNNPQNSGKVYMEGYEAVTRNHRLISVEPEGCEAEVDKTVQTRLLDGNDVQPNTSGEDVKELKVRLQALEGERVFMKQAIDSLRKENMELKLLQEIAQQLRELKGDANRADAFKGEPQDQQPLLSFLKGLFSFTGSQNSAHPKRTRFICPLQKSLDFSATKQKHGGLVELLEESPSARKTACVTRGLKVGLKVIKEAA